MKFRKTARRMCAISLLASMVSSGGMISASAALTEDYFESLGVIGSFNGWAEDTVKLSDDDDDGIWEAIIEIDEVTEDMIGELYSDGVATGKMGINFRVRANDDWDDAWGAYEEDYDRTYNSQTNMLIPEEEITIGEPLTVKVKFDTTGEDYNLWPVTYEITSGQSELVESNGFKYSVYEDHAVLVGYSGSDKKVVIPSSVNGKPVTQIRSSAFSGKSMQEIVVPDSVTDLSTGTFRDCRQLKSITLSSALKTIPGNCFRNCNSLNNIVFPQNLESIGNCAFSNCYSIEELTVPGTVETIENSAFYNCYGIKKLTLKSGIKYIGGYAFASCNNLTRVDIPGTVETIDYDAFEDCTGLKTVVIEDGVKRIDSGVFNNCYNMRDICIPQSVTYICYNVFDGYRNLTIAGVKGSKAEEYANEYDIPFCDITIPKNISTVESYAVKPGEPVKINGCAIYGTGSYKYSYSYRKAGTQSWTNIGTADTTEATASFKPGSAAVYDVKVTIKDSAGKTAEKIFTVKAVDAEIIDSGECGKEGSRVSFCFTADGTVTVFGSGEIMDYDCNSIFAQLNEKHQSSEYYDEENEIWVEKPGHYVNNVVIEDGITSLGQYSFYNIYTLKTVKLSSTVTNIGNYAFEYCNYLEKAEIPSSVTRIGDGAFYGCYNVTIYGYEGSYAHNYASENDLKFFNIGVPLNNTELSAYALKKGGSVDITTTAEYGSGSYTYAFYAKKDGAANWQTVKGYSADNTAKFTPSENGTYSIRTVVKDSAGKTAEEIFTVKVLDVEIIESGECGKEGSRVSYYFTADGTVTVFGSGEMMDYDGNSVFSQLNDKYQGSEYYDEETDSWVEKPGHYVNNVVIEDGITYVGDYSFYNIYTLKTAKLSSTVKKIGNYAFEYCRSLEKAEIPSSETEFEHGVFNDCYSVTLFGHEGSSVQTYASENNIKFFNVDVPLNKTEISCYGLKKGGTVDITTTAEYGSGSYTYAFYAKKEGAANWQTIKGYSADNTAQFKPGDTGCYQIKTVVKDSNNKSNEKIATVLSTDNEVVASGSCAENDGVSTAAFVFDATGTVTVFGSGSMMNNYNSVSVIAAAFHKYCSYNDGYYDDDGNWVESSPYYKMNKVVIGEGITSIGSYSFNGISTLNEVLLPSTLKSIGEEAFEYCRGLKKILIPESVESIGYDAFYGCAEYGDFTICGYPDSCANSYANNYGYKFVDASKPLNQSTLSSYGVKTGTAITINGAAELGSGGYKYTYSYKKSTSSSWTRIGTADTTETTATFKPGTKADYYVKVSVKDSKGNISEKTFLVRSGSENVVASGDFSYGDTVLSYILDDKGTLTVFGKGAIADYNYNNSPFRSMSENITKIVIESGITAVGKYAFYELYDVETVVLSNTVKSIGDSAFEDCSRLVKAVIPASVTDIHNYAFAYVYGVTFYSSTGSKAEEFAKNKGFKFVDTSTPVNYSSVDKCVVKPGGSVSITSTAEYGSGKYTYGYFYKKAGETTWTTLSAVSSTNSAVFKPEEEGTYIVRALVKDSAGKKVDRLFAVRAVEDNVERSGVLSSDDKNSVSYYLDGNGKLTIFGIGNTGDFIGDGDYGPDRVTPFIDCSDITSAVIEEGITRVGNFMFYDSYFIKSVVLPESLNSIGNYSFWDTSVSRVTIPANVQVIGEHAFHDTNGNKITFCGTEGTVAESYAAENDYDFIDISKPFNNSTLDNYAVASGDTVMIRGAAEYGSGNYTYSYYYKKSTTTSWMRIGSANTTETIAYFKTGSKADYDVKVVVKDSKGKISERYFKVRSLAERPLKNGKCGDNVFYMLDKYGTLTVFGSGNMDNYSDSYSSPLRNLGDYNEDENDTNVRVKSVIFEKGVTNVGKYALYGLSSLETVTLADSVTSIGYGAFSNCENLRTIEIPASVKTIEYNSFSDDDGVVICGYKGSYAEQYAKDNYIEFIDIEKPALFADVDTYAAAKNDKITLTANAKYGSGGFTYAYYYRPVDGDGNWTLLSDYSSKNKFTFTGYDEGDYELKVSVKDSKGQTAEKQSRVRIVGEKPAAQGRCGDDAYYLLGNDGTVYIYGTGEVDGFSWDGSPLKGNTGIKAVVIEYGITEVNGYLVNYCSELRKVFVSSTVNYISESAFYGVRSPLIAGSAGSYAERYAERNRYEFADVDKPYNESTVSSYVVKVGDTVTINGAADFGSGDYTYTYSYKKATSTSWNRIGNAGTTETTASFKTGSKADYDVKITVKDSKGNTADKEFTVRSTNANVVESGEIGNKGNNVCYMIEDNGTATIFGSGNMKDFSWENSIFRLREHSENGNSSDVAVKKLIVEEGVTSIGSYAFYNLNSLTDVSIPSTVTRINDYAFSYCHGLKSIRIPATVTKITSFSGFNSDFEICGYKNSTAEKVAKDYSYKFVDMAVTDNISTIDAAARKKGGSFTLTGAARFGSGSYKYTYDYRLSGSDDWIRAGSEGTTASSVTITPENEGIYEVRIIAEDSEGSQSEKRFTLLVSEKNIFKSGSCSMNPDSTASYALFTDGELLVFGSGAADKTFLQSDYYDDDYDNGSYSNSIKSIVISEGITSIGSNLFCNLNNLETVTFPENSLTSIGYYSFGDCPALKRVIIPDSVTSVDRDAFEYCYDLQICSNAELIAKMSANGPDYIEYVDVGLPLNNCTVSSYAVKPGESITLSRGAEFGSGEYTYSFGYRMAGESSWTAIADDSDVFTPEKSGTYFVKATVTDSNGNSEDKQFAVKAVDAGIVSSGVVGDNTSCVSYMMDTEGTLTVFGTGRIKNFNWNNSPFNGNQTILGTIRSIVIEEGITSVGDYSFRNNSSLKTLKLPESLIRIGDYAFSSDEKLERVVIPKNVEEIYDDAFAYCDGLVVCGYPESEAEDIARSYGYRFVDVTVPYNISTVPERVVKVGQTVTINGAAEFGSGKYTYSYYYKKASSASWSRIGSENTTETQASFTPGSAADYCAKVVVSDGTGAKIEKEFIIKALNYDALASGSCGDKNSEVFYVVDNEGTMTVFGSGTAANANLVEGSGSIKETGPNANLVEGSGNVKGSIKKIVVEKGVTGLAGSCFGDYNNLETAVLDDGITSIGSYAFEYCRKLKNINLPSALTSVGNSVFSSCSSLESVTIPEGIKNIPSYFFSGCTALKEVILPSGLTEIQNNAFSRCGGIESLMFTGGKVTYISEYAFNDADGIILCGEPGSYIEKYAKNNDMLFSDKSLPLNLSSVEKVGVKAGGTVKLNARAKYGSGSFTYTYYYKKSTSKFWTRIGDADTTETTASFTAGSAAEYNVKIVVKDSKGKQSAREFTVKAISADIAATGICGNNTSFVLDNNGKLYLFGSGSVTNGLYSAISDNYGSKTIYSVMEAEIGSGIKSVSDSTFSGFENLRSVVIPEGIESIGSNAFSGTNLKSVVLPSTVVSVGRSAFENCANLESVTLNEGLESIGSNAFGNCSKLSTLNIPSTVKSFDENIVRYSKSLSAINVSENNENLCSKNGVVYNKEMTKLICVPEGATISEFTVPATVTVIGQSAMRNCSNITNLVIPDSVSVIGSSAFAYCKLLKKAELPDSVASIGEYVFDNCASLDEIRLPSGITSIPESMFQGCKSLTEVQIPDGVTTIEEFAFNLCDNLSTVNIPSGVTRIGSHAFSNTDLQSIDLPDGVTYIGSGVFSNCDKLDHITIPAGVKEIYDSTFYGCVNLVYVVLPENLELIGYDAFLNCSSLERIDLPTKLKIIRSCAFMNTAMESLFIPASVVEIGGRAVSEGVAIIGHTGTAADFFATENSLEFRDVINPMNRSFIEKPVVNVGGNVVINGAAEFGSGDYTFSYFYKKAASSSWTRIGSGYTAETTASFKTGAEADYNVKVVVKDSKGRTDERILTIRSTKKTISECGRIGKPNSNVSYMLDSTGTVTIFGKGEISDFTAESSVFAGRDDIKSVKIESGVTSVGDCLFSNCKNLATIALADSIKRIGGYTFNKCAVTSVKLPVALESIRTCAFSDCSKLSSITLPGSLKSLGEATFSGCTSLSSAVIPEGMECVGYAMFSGCTALKNVSLPSTITSIYPYAFSGCSSLEAIALPEGLKYIYWDSFRDCTSLKEITIPASFEMVDSSVGFNNCPSLTKINVAAGNKDLVSVNGVLYSKDMKVLYKVPEGMKATQFIIPDGVERLNYSCFANCATLTKVSIPASVSYIPYNSFNNCTSLESVELPDGLLRIQSQAFMNCPKLTRLRIPSSVEYMDYDSFDNSSITLIGEEGSYAEGFAHTNNISFEALGSLVNESSVKSAEIAVGQEAVINGAASGGAGGYTFAYYYKKAARNTWTQIGSGFTTDSKAVFKAGSESTYDVKVIVKDSKGKTAEKLLKVKASKASSALSNNSEISSTEVKKGTPVKATGKASGGSGSYSFAFYYKKSTSSSWTTISGFGAASEASFTPAMAATYLMKVVVRDSSGNTSEKIFTVTSK